MNNWVKAGLALLTIIVLTLWLSWVGNTHNIVEKLPQRSRDIPLYVAPGVTPPTNSWFSSLAFAQPSHPVYAYPLAARTTEEGFELSYPRINAQPHVVMASFTKDLAVRFEGSSLKPRVESYDDMSVGIAFRRDTATLATMRLTQGSPVVPVHFRDESTLVFDNDVELNEEDGWYRLKANGRDYGMTVSPGVNVDSGNKRVSAGRDERVSFFVLPDSGGSQRIAEAASVSITGTEVHQSASGQDQVSTTLNIRTDDKKPALLALLPYHGQANGESLGSYKTILGTMELYRLNSHNFTTSLSNLDTELRLGGITGQEKARLAGFIRNDTKNLDFESDDTYFAGKELYRAANLLQLANQLDMKEQSKQLRDILGMQLRLWFDVRGSDTRDTRSFYYDETLRGIVGQAPSFGSEDFNDHHFHWGYFIYAAAVLADQDKGFKKEVSPMVNGLINDIASIDQTDGFPRLRVFDKYAGHSWASGFALMADGNNQESSSEAVNAWYATYLWADATGDQRQKDKARWLYAREVDFARRYYLTTDPSEHPQRNGYGSEIVSIVWGGKLDYATFFSDAPEAKLAIQLVPLSPGHAYVGDSEERVAARLDEVGNNPQDYRDYLVMYRATIDPDRALREADELADKDIDGANSWSYMYAWILAQRESQ